MLNTIKVRGARQHNLQNVDVDIPKDKFVVITGVSGSGKSSLAFDTIYAEGQRRYVESLSAYARQFLGVMDKPDVDLIEGLSSSNSSIDYIDETTNADGIISIKQNLLKYAKRLGFITILRTFLLDSKSLEILQKINMDSDIDILEILPGIVLTAVPEEVKKIQKVIIGGGLIHTPQMMDQILAAGASAVSTSDPHLWELL